MRIRKAKEKDFHESLKIAKSLDNWFSDEELRIMPIDFRANYLATAIDKNKVVGFLCYSADEGAMRINWLGIKKEYQNNRIGSFMLGWLENKAKKFKSGYLRVETLSEIEKNPYYERTRQFYYKKGFRKIYDFHPVYRGWSNTILLEKRLRNGFGK